MMGKIKRKVNKFFLKKNYNVLIECLKLSLKEKGDVQDYYFFKNGVTYFLNHGDLPLKSFKNSQYLKRRKTKIQMLYFFQGILETRQQLRYARMMLVINKGDNDERAKISKDFSAYVIRSYPEVIKRAKRRSKKIYLIVSSLILVYIILLLNSL